MEPTLAGVTAAAAWGSADFVARFTGRAVGPGRALLGALLVGALAMTALMFLLEVDWRPLRGAWWSIPAAGLAVASFTFLLYWGIARGPISVVCPIVGAYPLFNLSFAFMTGYWPPLPAWLGFAVLIAGVALVASFAEEPKETEAGALAQASVAVRPGGLKATIAISFAASFCYALAIIFLQDASALYGEFQAVALSRWVAVALVAFSLLLKGQGVRLPMRIWPLILLQGLLDGAAFLAVVQGDDGGANVIIAVLASAFWAVTVLLARFILKEGVKPLQWVGIAFIAGGAVVLGSN